MRGSRAEINPKQTPESNTVKRWDNLKTTGLAGIKHLPEKKR